MCVLGNVQQMSKYFSGSSGDPPCCLYNRTSITNFEWVTGALLFFYVSKRIHRQTCRNNSKKRKIQENERPTSYISMK